MKVFAHRGASGEFAENSLVALEQAIIQQSDGIELDAQYHPSGDWWLLHDLYVDKTTNGTGRLIALEKDYIQSLSSQANKPLVLLPQAIELIDKRCPINIEVKISTATHTSIQAAAKSLLTLIEQAIKNNRCTWPQLTVSSFNHLFLQAVKVMMPQVKIGALIAHCPSDLAACAQILGADTINLSLHCLNKALVDDAHQRGLEAWVYTVDNPADIQFCYEIGVDAIFSNFPLRTKEFIKSIS